MGPEFDAGAFHRPLYLVRGLIQRSRSAVSDCSLARGDVLVDVNVDAVLVGQHGAGAFS